MIRFSLRRFSALVARHPNWCLLIALVLTLLSVWVTSRKLVIEMDVAALLPEDSEVSRITRMALDEFGSFDFMLVTVEASEPGQEDLLKKAAEELGFALDDRRYIRDVTWRITPESLEIGTPAGDARAISLLTEEDWLQLDQRLKDNDVIRRELSALRARLNAMMITGEARDRLLEDPLNIYGVLAERVKIKSGPLKVNLRDQYFLSEDGMMLLVLVWPVEPATNLAFANVFQRFLEATHEGIYIRNPEFGDPADPENLALKISYFGPHYEAIADSQLVRRDFMRTSIISFAAVVLLFVVAFRRPEALIFVAIPLVVGVVWTLGLTTLFVGRLTQVTIVFSAILIGLGIDFSVHLYNRYIEEVRLGTDNRDAIRVAIEETGPGIIAGALTTAIAFLGLMFTRFVGFQELGLVGGVGVLCCLASVLLILPPMLAYFGVGPVREHSRAPMPSLGLRRFHFLVTNHPRVTLLACLVVVGYLGLHARDVIFEDDFRSLKQPSDDYVELHDRIMSAFKVPPNQIVVIVTGESDQAAMEANDQLYRNIFVAQSAGYDLVAIDSLRYYLPSQRTQRRQLDRLLREDLSVLRANLNNLAAEYNLEPQLFDQFFERLRGFQESARMAIARETMPVNLHDVDGDNEIIQQVARRYIYNPSPGTYRIVTRIYPPTESRHNWLSEVPEPFREYLSTDLPVPPGITGSVIIQEELRRLMIEDLARAVFLILAVIFVYLLLHFFSIPKALMALFPVVAALMGMLGIVQLLDLRLHYLNIIALPLVVGIGVDSCIHLIQRYYENDKRDLMLAITRTGRAVAITTLTTAVGFGSLMFANFRGIRELGILSVLGVVLSLLAALLLLPAVLRLTSGRRQGNEATSSVDLG